MPPWPLTVTAYCTLLVVEPWVPVSFWVAVTTNVMLDEPKVRIESIVAVPEETCFWLVRVWATPTVA